MVCRPHSGGGRRKAAGASRAALVAAGNIERACHSQRLSDSPLRCAVTDHHIDLIDLPAEAYLSRRAAPTETLELWFPHGRHRPERSAARLHRPSATSPANDNNHRSPGRDLIGRDLALGRPRPDALCPHHQHRQRIGHRSIRSRLHHRPVLRHDDADTRRRRRRRRRTLVRPTPTGQRHQNHRDHETLHDAYTPESPDCVPRATRSIARQRIASRQWSGRGCPPLDVRTTRCPNVTRYGTVRWPRCVPPSPRFCWRQHAAGMDERHSHAPSLSPRRRK